MTARIYAAPPHISALQRRWDDFLTKIETRFHETLDEAEPALVDMLTDDNNSIVAIQHAWSGIRTQLQQLVSRIDDTWSNSLRRQMMEYLPGDANGDWLIEQERGSTLETRLHDQLDLREIVIMGRVGERLRTEAMASETLTFVCKQCRAPLHVTTDLFTAHYETCQYCSTITTYEPSTRMRSVEWFATDALARWRTLDAWHALRQASEAVRAARGPAAESLLLAREHAHTAYYRSFLEARIAVNSAHAATFDADLARYERELIALPGR
jgi:hypothetical protein